MAKGGRVQLSPHELRRVIVRCGGLWSPSDLARLCGERAKKWPGREGFPEAVWRTGQKTKLYSGWAVWDWLVNAGHESSEAALYEAILKMRVRKGV